MKFKTKKYNSVFIKKIFVRFLHLYQGFLRWIIGRHQSHSIPTDHCRHGNKILNNISHNSVFITIYRRSLNLADIFKVGLLKGVSNFYHDWPLLPWQQNLKHNGLYLGLHNKYYQDPCIWRRCGLRVWQLDDASEVYHSQTWFLGITSSSVVGAAVVVDTSNVLYSTGGILLCLKNVKGKGMCLAIALLTRVRLIPRLDFWQ